MNLNKECKDLSYAIFVTGIVSTIIFLFMYVMIELAPMFEFSVAIYIMILSTISMFAVPILLAYVMIDLYHKNEERGLQTFSSVGVIEK